MSCGSDVDMLEKLNKRERERESVWWGKSKNLGSWQPQAALIAYLIEQADQPITARLVM